MAKATYADRSAPSSRQPSFAKLPNVANIPRRKSNFLTVDRAIPEAQQLSVPRSNDVRTNFSTTYQMAVQKLYEEREKHSAPHQTMASETTDSSEVGIDDDDDDNHSENSDTFGSLRDARENHESEFSPFKKSSSALFAEDLRSVARQDARRRWRKIKTRLDEIRNDRQALKHATGWESVFKRVREMVSAERVRRDLYERYGFIGVPSGQYPTNNPMSLYPASKYPNGDEEDIPPTISSFVRKMRVEVSRLYVQSANSKIGSRPHSANVAANGNERMTKYLNELRTRTLSQMSTRAATSQSSYL